MMETNKEPVIIINNVSKSFGRTAALDGVSYTVEPGTVYALL